LVVICISYLLFKIVESLYFSKENANKKQITSDNHDVAAIRFPRIKIFSGGIIFSLIVIILYSGTYPISQSVFRNSFTRSNMPINKEVSLLSKPLIFPFKGEQSNLSEIIVLMRYIKDASYTRSYRTNPSVLLFNLYDTKTNKLVYTSKREGFLVEGALRFPFGFPAQIDSKDKSYVVEIKLINGRPDDQVVVDTSSDSFISIYANEKTNKFLVLEKFIINRLVFVFSNSGAQFTIFFIVVIMSLQFLSPKKIRFISKILSFPNKNAET
jgi:hypothetical protein